MSIKQQLLHDINLGKEGKLLTIPIGLPKLGQHVYVGKNMYHLIGGAGGSGKSAFVDLVYILMVYKWFMKNKDVENVDLKIILRSMERSGKHRVAKWVCMYIYLKYNYMLDVPRLMHWGYKKSNLPQEMYEFVNEALDYFEKAEEHIDIVDGSMNPTGIFRYAEKYMLQNGKMYRRTDEGLFERSGFQDTRKVSDDEAKTLPTVKDALYIPKNNRKIVIHITDHLQALRREKGFNDKENLDKFSEYSRDLRDLYGAMVVNVSQLNRGVADTMRRKTELLPEDKDFSGSSNMYNDCDMASILFNPYKYNIDDVQGYEVKKMLSKVDKINRFRTLHLLKNTYGADNLIFGLQFVGENGYFTEIPRPDDITQKIYEQIANPQVLNNFCKK